FLISFFFFFARIRLRPTSTLFPYTTLFRSPAGDALHLALASYHKCDFLVTWNCRHLANANKFGHIRRVNALLGLFVPALVTPLEDRKSTRLNSSHQIISYAVFCLKKKTTT